jgi:hypothetical protein
MTTLSIGERVAQLEEELAARKNPLDLTLREADAYLAQTEMISARIYILRSAPLTLAEVDHKIASDTEWFDFLTTTRKTLCDELLALPAHIRTSHQMGVQQNLKFSIQVIDRGLGVIADSAWELNTLRLGELMKAARYVEGPRIENQICGRLPWFGSLQEVERRLKGLQQQRNEAQARLTEALLDDAERAQLAAEEKVRRDTLNAAPQRKTRLDGSVYLRYSDGHVVEVSA